MKNFYATITGVFLTMLLSLTAMSQTLIPSSGSNSMNSNGTLCTHLGCGAGYWNNVDGYTVVNVTPGNRVQISGSYNIEPYCDYVVIYSGVGTGGTVLATYNGTGSFCYTGNFGETLTVRFYTDYSVIYTGLNATVLYNPSAPADPTGASASSPVICNGSSTSLSATGAVGTVYWYSGSCGGTLVGTGNPLSVSPSSTTTYYARNFNNCVFSPGCASTTVTVNPVPTVNAVFSQEVCNGNSTSAMNFTGAVPGTVYNWTNSVTSIGLGASGTGNIAAFTGINTSNDPVWSMISVTPQYTNAGVTCTGTTGYTGITVDPTPVADPVTDLVVCHNSATGDVNFSSPTTGGGAVANPDIPGAGPYYGPVSFSWTNDNTAIGLAASGSGAIPSFTATNNGTKPDTANITVIPSLAGVVTCTGNAIHFRIIVNPKGQVNAVASQVLCAGASSSVNFSTNNTIGTTTYAWTNDNTSIGLGASGSGNIGSFTAANSGATQLTGTVTVTPTFTNSGVGCAGSSASFTIAVNPTPSVVKPADQVVCNNSSTAAVTLGDGVLVLGADSPDWVLEVKNKLEATGAFSRVDAIDNTMAQPTLTDLQKYKGVLLYTDAGFGDPTALGNNLASYIDGGGGVVAAVFETASFPISGTYNSNTYRVIIPAGQTQGTTTTLGTVHLPAHAVMNGVTSFSGGSSSYRTTSTTLAPGAYRVADWSDGRFLIAAKDNVGPMHVNRVDLGFFPPSSDSRGDFWTASTDGVKIMKNALEYVMGGTGGTYDYSWTNSNTSIGLAASGSGSIPSFTAVNTGTSPVTATITITPSFTKDGVTCSGTHQSFTITVNPTGQVNDPADQVLCNNSNTTAVNFATNNTGGTSSYAWTNNTTSIGLAASGTGNIASFTAANTGTAPVTATVAVTPTFTNASVGCSGTAQTFTMIVNPTANVAQPTDQTVCIGATVSQVFSTTNTGGTTTYAWTNSNTAIGLAASGTGNINTFFATNSGTSPVTGTVVVTPTFTNAGVGCSGTAKTFYISVNPTGQVNDPADQVVCNNSPTTAVNFTTNNTGGTTTYAWTNDNTAIGLAASGTGDIASFTAVNTGTSPVTATITVTPTFTNSAPGLAPVDGSIPAPPTANCTGTAQTFTITVNPTAQVAQPVDQVVCINATVSQVFTTNNTGGTTTYAWTNDNTAIGLAASGTGNINTFFTTNNTTAPLTATVVVTPTFTNAGVSCTGPAKTFYLTVNPSGQVDDPADQVICNNSSTTAVNFSTVNTGGTTTYTWANNTTSIGLAASGSGNIASFTAVNTGTAPVTATITVTPTFSGGTPTGAPGIPPPPTANCTGTAQTFTITVNPTAQVDQPVDQVICNNATVSQVFSTQNTGGTTTYAWTNSNTAIGLAASGTGNINTFFATNSGTSPITATVVVTPTFTNGGVSCTGPAKTFYLTVNPVAQVDDPADQLLCNNSTTNAVNFTTLNSGGTTTYAWTNSNVSIGLAASGSGNIAAFTALNTGTAPATATVTVTPSFSNGGTSCSGPAQTFSLTVNPTAQVNQPSNIVVCTGSTASATFGTVNTGGTTTYTWTNSNTAIGLAASGSGNIPSFNVVNNGTTPLVATITVTPTYTNGGVSCSGPAKSFTITVNGTPTVVCTSNINVVNDPGVCGAVVTYPAAIVTGAPTPTLSYSMPSGSLFPIGTTTVTVTATNVCTVVTCSFTVTVRDTEAPVITCPSNITVTATGACTKVVNYTVTATDNCPGFTLVRTAGLASGSAFPLGVTTITHRVTDASGNISTCSFTVTVLDGQIPVIGTQPVNTTVCAGTTASFNVASSNVVSYQWQSWNGSGWSDIAGSNNAVYQINNAALNMNTNTYRVTIVGLCNNAVSNIATVYVNPNPFVTITASGSPAMVPGQFLTLTANVSVTGGVYKWYKNDVLMDNATTAVISGLTVDDAGTYKVVYTDGNGCTYASATIQITAAQTEKMFAYPNPNTGTFSVRFYNNAGETVTMNIYNDRGRLIYQRNHVTNAPYTNMEVNLLKEGILSSGYYLVEIRDHSGKQIAVRTIIVYR